jgi:hypothetical protein
MSYFQAVRIYSALELMIFATLVTFAIGGFDESVKLTLGWTHGIGWILLCIAVAAGCVRRGFPWPLLAATVSPLGPVGSTIGLEYLARRRR